MTLCTLWSVTCYHVVFAANQRRSLDACVTSSYALAMLSGQLQNFHCRLSVLFLSWRSCILHIDWVRCCSLIQAMASQSTLPFASAHGVTMSLAGSSVPFWILLLGARVLQSICLVGEYKCWIDLSISDASAFHTPEGFKAATTAYAALALL